MSSTSFPTASAVPRSSPTKSIPIASGTTSAVPSIPSTTPTVAKPSINWEEVTALDNTQNHALTQLSLAMTQRLPPSVSAIRFSDSTEQKSKIHDESRIDAGSSYNSVISMVAQGQRQAIVSAAQRSSYAEKSEIREIDATVTAPFSGRSQHAKPSNASHTADMYALLLNTQMYASTPEYISHLTKLDGVCSSVTGESEFKVDDPAKRVANGTTGGTSGASAAHIQYYLQLRSTSSFLQRLVDSTHALLTSSSDLLTHFSTVFEKTNSVREECSALLAEQQSLAASTFKFNFHLSYFVEYDAIQAKLTDIEQQPVLAKFMRDFNDLQTFNNTAHTVVDPLSSNPIHSPEFSAILTSLDHCVDYMRTNSDFLDATQARVRYEKLHATILRNVRNFVRTNIERAVRLGQEQASLQPAASPVALLNGSDLGSGGVTAVGVYQLHPSWMRIFVQLRSLAQALKPLMLEMEHRAFAQEGGIFGAGFATSAGTTSTSVTVTSPPAANSPGTALPSTQPAFYKDLLLDCYRLYIERRHALLYGELQKHLTELTSKKYPLSQLIRSACTSWIELCGLESQLFLEFFSSNHFSLNQLNDLLSGFCTLLYATLRPVVIQSPDMDALAEVITILKFEVLEEQQRLRGGGNKSQLGSSSSSVANESFHPSSPLYSFAKSIQRLIADVQERLIYRAQMHIRESIQKYQHSKEDLAYPAKLHATYSGLSGAATAAQPSAPGDATTAALDPTSMVSPDPAASALSPASREHLFSTWHPALERTLMCLSKLYRCVEPSVFKYLAQEAVNVCVSILIDASNRVSMAHLSSDPRASDGLLFLIKHLLILREQILPFSNIDWSTTSADLDFSHMKDVLPNIFSSVGKWSSFIDLVQTSAPRLKENKMDAKKLLESHLKTSCEQLIASQTQYLIGALLEFFNHMGAMQQAGDSTHQPEQFKGTLIDIVGNMVGRKPFSATASSSSSAGSSSSTPTGRAPFAEQIRLVVSQTSLYLANPVTERVLYQPILQSVRDVLKQLLFFVETHFPPAAKSDPSVLEEDSTAFLQQSIQEMQAVLDQVA